MSVPVPVRPRTRWRFTVLFGIAGALVVGIVVLAFVWPAATAKARDLPVGLSGPTAQVDALKAAIAKQETDPFAFATVSTRADAVRQIRERRLYGAILLGDEPEVLTSSAASTASNQVLRGVATQLQAQVSARAIAGLQQAIVATAASSAAAGAPTPAATGTVPAVKVTDVVALSSRDATGAGLAAAGFPLVLGGMLGGVLVSFLVVGPMRRIVALLVYGVAAGGIVVLVLQTWLGILQRDPVLNAAAFGLAMAATAAIVSGCNALLGSPGIGVGAVISLLIGNPISGATLPYQFIAAPWGEVGQWFVPGAASSLVRSLSYFPDADVSKQWLVLGVWTLAGFVLTIAGHFRDRSPAALPASELEPAGA
ncbi:hypothetical protein [uncultured Amnibacterium sp.]|uniref:hypothetical protein n=1 Tax=uncultured Amnibacterium sp. TaxID=1631851 RepID=UPI0035CC96AF